jgi:ketosteroid isomerase-like protein
MTETYATAQDAEDAFYDALEERSAERMAFVWSDLPDIACLLPMQPLLHGDEVRDIWAPMFAQGDAIDLQVRHIRWVELGDLAIHYVQEWIAPPPGHRAPTPVYATNVFRRGASGWNLLLHQNSPAPPPPGAMGGQSPL